MQPDPPKIPKNMTVKFLPRQPDLGLANGKQFILMDGIVPTNDGLNAANVRDVSEILVKEDRPKVTTA